MVHFLDEGMKVIKDNSSGGVCDIKPKNKFKCIEYKSIKGDIHNGFDLYILNVYIYFVSIKNSIKAITSYT